jgi:hypothetical protein
MVTTDPRPRLVSDQNLSEWRKGGYQDWLKRRERLDHTRELAQYSVKLAKANGGTIAEGAIAIASGYILELLEACDGTLDPETTGDLLNALAKFQSSEAAKNRTDLDREKLKRLDEQIALERQKFMRDTGKLSSEDARRRTKETRPDRRQHRHPGRKNRSPRPNPLPPPLAKQKGRDCMRTNPEDNVWLVFSLFFGRLLGVEFVRQKAEDACENPLVCPRGYTCGRHD